MYQSMLVRSGCSALATFSAIFALALAGGGLLIAPSMALAAVSITTVGGGSSISIDKTSASGGSNTFSNLNGPTIAENNPGEISQGVHTLTLPGGWEFDTVSAVFVFPGGGDISLLSNSAVVTSQTVSFEVATASTVNSSVVLTGLKVKPTGTLVSTGNITHSGAAITGVTNGSTSFGTLTSVAGTVTKLAFTTQPATTVYGSNLSSVVVKTQDQFDNPSANGLGSTETVTLSLNGSGTLQGTLSQNIGTGGGNGTATFSDLTVNFVGTGDTITATPSTYAPIISSSFNITPLPITVTTTSGQTKVYGQADPVFAYTVTSGALVSGDSFTGTLSRVGGDTVANYAINQGTLDAGANYALTFVPDNFSITAKNLTISGATAVNKIYDGNNTATLDFTGASLVVVETGDTGNVTINSSSASGIFPGVNVATGQTVTVTGVVLAGSAAGNYTVSQPATSANITPRPITVTATGVNKEYDRTTNATVNLSSDKISGDDVTLAYTTASFVTKIAENNKTVNVSGINISGSKAGNYNLLNTTEQTTANVMKKALSATLNLNNKTYDGDTSAAYSSNPRVANGVIEGDTVVVENTGTKAFVNKNIGVGKVVNATGLTLSGADAGNYEFNGVGTGIATINARPITITAVTSTKTYNGTAASAGIPVITNTGVLTTGPIMGSDIAGFTQAYNTENVGTGKTLTPSGTVTDGNGGANYTITPVTVSTGEITPAPLTATVIVQKKVVDGNNSATITSVTLSGILLSDVVTVNSQGTATFANASVGNDKVVTATGVTITGGDAGNYSFGGTATGTGDILAVPTVVYVDDNWAGTGVVWTDPDGTGPATYFGYDAFAIIQEAITAVGVGGTVNVLSGTYTESVTINKSLTVQKETSALTKPIVQANDNWGFKLLGAANITVDGFEIQITGGGSANDQAIRLENADGAVIKNNTIATTADTALGIWTCGTDSGCASSDNVNIDNNNITIGGVATGIYAEQVNGAHTGWSITGNDIVADAGVPLELYDVTDSTVDDNTLDGSTTNSNTIWSSQRANISDLVFTNNIISDSSGSMVAFLSDFLLLGDGLDNTAISGVDISGNTFNGWGSRGLRIGDGVTAVTVNENKFLGTGEALKNEDAASVNAEENWWGTAVVATIDGKTNGTIDFEPYYVESGMGILSNVAVNTAYVDSTYSDGAGNGGHYFGYDAFATIQEGIDAVASSGTVNVAAGTYNEQLQINKDITVSGTTGATIQPTGNDDAWDIQFVAGGSGATLEGFTLDFNGAANNRAGRGIGVSDQGGPAVTNVTIQNNGITMGVGIGAATGGLEGVGIQTGLNADVSGLLVTGNQFHGGSAVISDGNSQGEEGIYINPNSGIGSITISNNTFDGQLFTGISIESDNVTASGNTVTRSAAVPNTNGIRVNDFVGGKSYDVTLANNTISGFANGFRLGSGSEGGSTLAISLTDNTISNNTRGVWVRYDAVVTASENSITGNVTGAEILSGSDGSLSAEGNWWGFATGPADGAVVGTVDYRPWCTNEVCSPIDTTPPTVTVDTLLTNDTTPVITGTVVESNAVTVTITVNSQNYVAVVTSGTWSAGVTNALTAGTYSVTATAEDSAGNISTDTTSGELQIDLTAPTVSLTEDHADTIVRDADTVVITATFNEAMASSPTITINAVADDVTGVAMTNTSGNIWTYSWNVPSANDGSAVVTVAGSDTAGNAYTGTDSLTFTIDNTAPVVAITQPTADSRVNAAKVITFTDDGTAPQCSVNSSAWATCTSGTTTLGDLTGFSALGDVGFTLNLRDTDTAGNIGTAQVAIVKDTSAPSITSKSPDASAVGVDPTLNITVVFNEDVVITSAQVTLQKGSDTPVSTVVSGTGTVTINPATTLENNSTYTVTLTGVTDTAGNALPTTSWTFTTAGSYSFTLTNGWNLIALGVVPNNNSISTILGDSSGNVESIWSYDAVTDTWSVNHPNSSEDTDTPTLLSMTAGNGYWVNYTSASPVTLSGSGNLFLAGNNTPPSRTLKAGWNLLGYYQRESNTTALVTNALKTLKSQDSTPIPWWSMIVKHDNSAKQFGTVENNSLLSSGQGYWILMGGRATDTYIYAPGVTDPQP